MKEILSFEQVFADCGALAENIKKTGDFTKIVAVTRGGMVPACIVAQILDIREIASIAVKSYDEKNVSRKLECLVNPAIEVDEKTVFIDDLYESGQTYDYLKSNFPKAKVAELYSKSKTAELDFPAVIKEKDTWLVFPWEVE